MSGDGSFVEHNGTIAGAGAIYIPSGEGGGCITSGPFQNMVANLGPVSPAMDGQQPVSGLFEYNPRCLKRDLSAYTASSWLTVDNLLNLTQGEASKNIKTFQDELQGRFTQGFLGLHAGGHFVMGGDAGDLFSAPVDPVFWLHHAQLDKVWFTWQMLHKDQAKTVAGTITIFDTPPSRNTTLDDEIDMSVNGETRTIRELLSTIEHGLCYVYL
jgi:tyrosinase